MRLPTGHPQYAAVGGDGAQLCRGELIRARTLTGICNDLKNPLMGSTGTAVRAQRASSRPPSPSSARSELTRNRHGDRLASAHARSAGDQPQALHARPVATRPRATTATACPASPTDASCDYKKAPFFNVLAAFWIQFMTHDWFSHLRGGAQRAEHMPVGCDRRSTARRRYAGSAARLPARRSHRPRLTSPTSGTPPTFTADGKRRT